MSFSSDPIPNKSLGQHFLRDQNIIRKITEAVDPQKGETVVEIGPGPGALTIPLLAHGANVLAIEKDERFKGLLEGLSKSRGGELTFCLKDALKMDWPDIVQPDMKVAGNLPYNVGTQIVLNLLQSRVQPKSMIFMLQKEVIDRFTARPNSSARGRISVWCELLSDAKTLFDVSQGAFNPTPKVVSAVMRLTPLAEPRYDVDMAKLKLVLDTTFNQRRKMLRASLKHHLSADAIEAVGVIPTARPENLTTKEFCALANALAS